MYFLGLGIVLKHEQAPLTIDPVATDPHPLGSSTSRSANTWTFPNPKPNPSPISSPPPRSDRALPSTNLPQPTHSPEAPLFNVTRAPHVERILNLNETFYPRTRESPPIHNALALWREQDRPAEAGPPVSSSSSRAAAADPHAADGRRRLLRANHLSLPSVLRSYLLSPVGIEN